MVSFKAHHNSISIHFGHMPTSEWACGRNDKKWTQSSNLLVFSISAKDTPMALAFEVEAPLVEWAEKICVSIPATFKKPFPMSNSGRFHWLMGFVYRDEELILRHGLLSQYLRLSDIAVQGPDRTQQGILWIGGVKGR